MPITIIPDTGINNLYVNPDTGTSLIISGSVGPLYPDHNALSNIQGGLEDEFYHLTSAEYSNLVTGSVVYPSETGNFITNDQTGQFYANSNPSGFITGVDLSPYATKIYVTGISGDLQTQISDLNVSTGNLNTRLITAENDINILEFATGELNNYVIDLQGVTGTFVLYSETGKFYSSSNPSGFITGVDLSSYATQEYVTGISGDIQTQITNLNDQTGSYVLNTETGIFYTNDNPSGYITGIDDLVYTTGDQFVGGIKIFGQQNNILNSSTSHILGGFINNIENSIGSVILGGQNNTITGSDFSNIAGGLLNTIENNTSFSSIIGGEFNSIQSGSEYSSILGGRRVIISSGHDGATVLGDGQDRNHLSKGSQTCSLDFASGVFINNGLKINSTNHQITLGTGDAGNKIILTTPLTINGNRTYTIPDIGSSAAFVLTNGNQTINGIKTFSNNIIGDGTSNLFANEAGDSPHSVLTQQQLMLNGHKFRQLVNVNSKIVGGNVSTVAGAFQVLGLRVAIGNAAGQSAAAYTLDGLFCTDISTANLPINNEIDAYFHGVAMQFVANSNWKARINFGTSFAKTVSFSESNATITDKQWGVEFYWSGSGNIFYGRLYYYFDGPIQYGEAFTLPIYTSALPAAWGGFVYSIRMRQAVIAANKLRLEFYINSSASNNGGTQLSKTTPLSTLETNTITNPNYRFDGKHINFEVASHSTQLPSNQIKLQCTNMYCQFK